MQSIPLAVLKLLFRLIEMRVNPLLHAIHTACGIETLVRASHTHPRTNCMQSIPLAVLKKDRFVQKIPKSMKRSPAAEPQGFFCYGSLSVFWGAVHFGQSGSSWSRYLSESVSIWEISLKFALSNTLANQSRILLTLVGRNLQHIHRLFHGKIHAVHHVAYGCNRRFKHTLRQALR